jgi:spore maturation protein CgeB/predicted SAM-dependent methyltransferase
MVGGRLENAKVAHAPPAAQHKLDRLLKKARVKIRIRSRSDNDPDLSTRLLWGDHWVKHELGREFRRLGLSLVVKDPDVIIHLFGSPGDALPDNTYNVVWLYSHPDMVTTENLGQFDKILCASPDFMPKLKAMGYTNVEIMIPSTSKRPSEVPITHDIIFVGNARSRRPDGRSVVRHMGQTPYDFKVWGNLWEHILPTKYYGGRYWDYRKLDRLYASARITLTDHHPDMAREGFVSNKIFDILASGGFAISDRNPGLEKIFGKAVPQYESADHLQELVEFYLVNPDEREKLMFKGREIALNNTYRDRAIQFAREFLPPAKGRILPVSPGKDGSRQGKKITYIDLFRKENSNPFWLKTLQKYGEVQPFDIRDDLATLAPRIASFRPDHIHLGGSVKKGIIRPKFLAKVKVDSGCTISAFYGDGRYSTYHYDLGWVVDHIYTSNKTHIEQNRSLGLANFHYLPCPTDPEIFRPMKGVKKHDLLFVGNNNNLCRLELLRKIHHRFNLSVAGTGWKGEGFEALTEAYGPEFSRLVGQARILLGLIGDEWSGLEAYFSNRVANTLACGGFLIQRYTPGLEKVFRDQEHLVWYRTEEELFDLIERYLGQPAERKRIARQGRELVVSSFTYDRAVARILEEAGANRGAEMDPQPSPNPQADRKDLKLHLGCGKNLLPGYVNIDKYNRQADRLLDVSQLDYPDGSVSEILTSHMIEHVPLSEFQAMLLEWKRALKPGGRLTIRCPNHELYMRMWLEGDDTYRWGPGLNAILGIQNRGPGHFNRNLFTVNRLEKLVRKAGFEVHACQEFPTRTGHLPNGDILCRASKPSTGRKTFQIL